jgi:hypothetical protein
MFADLDESIRQLLIQRGHLNSGEIDIAFDMPTRDWASRLSKPTLNVYLFDVRENLELRNPAPWSVRPGPDNTAIKSRPDVRLDVTYRITAFANAVEDEHRLLSRALVVLYQHPMLPGEVLQGDVAGQQIPGYPALPSAFVQSPSDYWGALDQDIKPSIDYRLTVRMDLGQELAVGSVLTRRVDVAAMEGNGRGPVESSGLTFGGRVHRKSDSEAGIPGAKVTLVERGLDAITNKEGRYTFTAVAGGKYTLAVSAPGVGERQHEIEVPGANYDIGL